MLTSSHLKAKSPVQYTKVDDHMGNVNALLNNIPESVLSLIQDKASPLRKARKGDVAVDGYRLADAIALVHTPLRTADNEAIKYEEAMVDDDGMFTTMRQVVGSPIDKDYSLQAAVMFAEKLVRK